MSQETNPADHSPLRRCACPSAQELRWESPRRRMYSCSDCGIWWEEPKVEREEEPEKGAASA